MRTNCKELSAEELEQVSAGTFDHNKYRDCDYANAGIGYVYHLIARNEFWWNGSNIGHDNANAVVFFCQANGGRQPASLEEAIRFKNDHPVDGHGGCDLLHLA